MLSAAKNSIVFSRASTSLLAGMVTMPAVVYTLNCFIILLYYRFYPIPKHLVKLPSVFIVQCFFIFGRKLYLHAYIACFAPGTWPGAAVGFFFICHVQLF